MFPAGAMAAERRPEPKKVTYFNDADGVKIDSKGKMVKGTSLKIGKKT